MMKKVIIVIVVLIFAILAALAVFNKIKNDNLRNAEQASNTATISGGTTSLPIATELPNNSPSPTAQDSAADTDAVSPSSDSASMYASKTCMIDKMHNVFFGTIGDKEICMDIYQDGSDITAFCIYKISEDEMKLVGHLDGFKISLKDETQNILTGTFTSADEPGGAFKGTFIQSNGDELTVLLDLGYACGSNLDNFYEMMGSSNQEIETFLIELKNNIISANKQAIAPLINYPINVFIGEKDTTINSAQEFIDNYSKIMNEDFVNEISGAYTKYVFNNSHGVMFGGNWVNFWIQNMNDELKIIGINN